MRGLFKNCSRTVQEPIAVIIGDHGKIIQNAKKKKEKGKGEDKQRSHGDLAHKRRKGRLKWTKLILPDSLVFFKK